MSLKDDNESGTLYVNDENIDGKKVSKLRKYKIPNEVREKIIDYFNDGKSCKWISDHFELGYSGVFKVIDIFRKTGRVLSVKRTKYYSKLTDEQKDVINKWVAKDASISEKELVFMVKKYMNVEVSTFTVNRCIKNFHYSIFQTGCHPPVCDLSHGLDDKEKYVKEFTQMVKKFKDNQFIFIHCAKYIMHTRTKKPCSKNGNSIIRSRNVYILVALNTKGILKHLVLFLPLNEETLRNFILDINFVQDPVYIIERSLIDQYDKAKELIKEKKLTFLYLPQFSLEFNPANYCIEFYRNKVIDACIKGDRELTEALKYAYAFVSPQDCFEFCRKMLVSIKRSQENVKL